MKKKTIVDAGAQTFNGKRVLVRVDFNVPQDEEQKITDDSRIRAALPTIDYLRKAGAKIVLVSHLGRPKGKSEKLSLKPVAKKLSEHLNQDVPCLQDSVGQEVESFINQMTPGQVCLLENIRFYSEEEKNDPEFSKKLAKLADVYVNDAFGTAHRAHSSTEGAAHHVKPALAGLLMDKELSCLSKVLTSPQRPFATIIGGSKVSSKIGVLENLLKVVDVLVIGGAMANTFLKAQGHNLGKSLLEEDRLDFCRKLLADAQTRKVKIILPVDVVLATEFKTGVKTRVVTVDKIESSEMALDVGPATMKVIGDELSKCRTILWNGPVGAFEILEFASGTNQLIDQLVKVTASGATTIVGGGDSVAAIEAKAVDPQSFSHVSTGGGASLEYLEGVVLPGVACLDDPQTAACSSK